jgi:UDP-GlcNAc:undecaprenyl-phosphate/decaprenyl-phosphate GlcNAc-1-phosphate transferase
MTTNFILVNTFLVVFALSNLLIWLQHKTGFLLNKADLIGVQKFHKNPTPRIAGISIFIGFFVGAWLTFGANNLFYSLVISSLPVFLVGLIEDLNASVSPSIRMMGAFLSASIAFFLLNIKINELGFENVDYVLTNYVVVSFIFTVLTIAVVINAINIIDGFNGLMIGYSLIVLSSIAYIGFSLQDDLILHLSLLLLFSLLGIFILNFPFGKIFAGDGGAYFIGFMIAIIGLMLGIRNEEITHWFILLLLIYPLFEVVFSIYRKKILLGFSPSEPDGSHLHMLIYGKLLKSKFLNSNSQIVVNSLTSPFLWLLALIGILPALIWYDNKNILIITAVIFMMFYSLLYKYIAKINRN